MTGATAIVGLGGNGVGGGAVDCSGSGLDCLDEDEPGLCKK